MHDTVRAFRPAVVAVDPISNLTLDRDELEVKPTLMRLIDYLKKDQITAVFTSLTSGGTGTTAAEDSQVGVSSLMDAWLLLRNSELNGERNRTLYVLKARGTAHSNQVREFILSNAGIDLVDVHLDGDRVLTGSARIAHQARENAAAGLRGQDHERKKRQLAVKRKAVEAQIAALKAEVDNEEAELEFAIAQEILQDQATRKNALAMTVLRGGSKPRNPGTPSSP